ncbi:claudin-34-like [Mastomys coucha]|uniref:claudin-34-like n=1 Tax=Mastomys coucha TaxID=35658 RepID=UPI001261613F|nr:claudin-34-like [Mastomys coucha]
MLMKMCHHQMGGFALTTVAWLLCCISTGLPQWQVWHYEDPVILKPTVAFVGMWRACVFYNDSNSNNNKVCHQYNYADSFVPLYIRINQHLLLVSSFLGLFGKITTIIALSNMYMGRVRRNDTCNPFSLSGILNIIVSSFLYLVVLLNYIAIMRKWGVAFPPSFHMPSHPDTQKIGSAMTLAIIAAVLFLLSGTICLSSNLAIGKMPHSKI